MSNSRKNPDSYRDKCPICHHHFNADIDGDCPYCIEQQAKSVAENFSDIDANDITIEQEAERFQQEQQYYRTFI